VGSNKPTPICLNSLVIECRLSATNVVGPGEKNQIHTGKKQKSDELIPEIATLDLEILKVTPQVFATISLF